jgi:hypothetical protein
MEHTVSYSLRYGFLPKFDIPVDPLILERLVLRFIQNHFREVGQHIAGPNDPVGRISFTILELRGLGTDSRHCVHSNPLGSPFDG